MQCNVNLRYILSAQGNHAREKLLTLALYQLIMPTIAGFVGFGARSESGEVKPRRSHGAMGAIGDDVGR